MEEMGRTNNQDGEARSVKERGGRPKKIFELLSSFKRNNEEEKWI